MIVGSQSRWIKQLDFYGNSSLIEPNTTNKYGSVDSNFLVSEISDLSHSRNDLLSLGVVNAFSLVEDGFEIGKNSISSWQKFMEFNSTFPYTWNDEFWFACNFKTTSGHSERVIFTHGSNQSMVFFGLDDGHPIMMLQSSASLIKKRLRAVPQYKDDVWRRLVFHTKGLSDFSDSKIYINGVEIDLTEDFSDDLSAISWSSVNSRIGSVPESHARSFVGDLGGNILIKAGNPDLQRIEKYL